MFKIFLFTVTSLLVAASLGASAACDKPGQCGEPKTIRDIMWAWGVTGLPDQPEPTIDTFAKTSPMQHARLLGVPNVTMCGNGLPDEPDKAEIYTSEVAPAKQVVWEIMAESEKDQLYPSGAFVYRNRMALIRNLVDRYPQITGVLVDDMSTVGRQHGFKPEHLRRIRRFLPSKYESVKLWGVVYTMSMNDEGINDYIKELDVINLWVWHGKDIVDIEKNVGRLESLFPNKPIVLGLYLYDYGDARRMPLDLLRKQCETALKLAHEGRITGIVFLTINDDADAVGWTADWIKSVGNQRIGCPKSTE